MIQDVLSSIGGIGVYGVISVLIFFAVFLGVLVWSLGLKQAHLEAMSRLPLEEDSPPPGESRAQTHSDTRHE